MSDEGPIDDFRIRMVREKLKRVRRMLVVLSGKGGVGKSVIAATIAAQAAHSGKKVGIMDADVYGPTSASILGGRRRPKEGHDGLIPPEGNHVKVMSVDLFAPGKPIPISGAGASEIILEMMALTDWGDLDLLVIDMPPATGDIMMTMTMLGGRRARALVVTTPERLSLSVARRTLELLKASRTPVVGIVGNMYRLSAAKDQNGPMSLARQFHVPFLGALLFDEDLIKAVEKRNARRLLETRFARDLAQAFGP